MNPIWFLRPLLSPAIKKFYNIKVVGKVPAPPYLLIANHTHFFDPFFIHSVIEEPIYWVVAKGNFEHPVKGGLFKSLGFIPKQKGVPDFSTIRNIYRNLKKGNIVGIFPEGSVTWDGNFQEVPKGTDKLLNMVKAKIVAVKIQGGYLTKPRWADYGRKGTVTLEFREFSGDEALDFINHNEWDWQGEQRVIFKGNNRAKGIERIIWYCPECGTFRSIVSLSNVAYCKRCGAKLFVDEFGYVANKRIDHILSEQLNLLIDDFYELGIAIAIVREKRKARLLKKIRGVVKVTKSYLSIGHEVFELSRIKGVTTFLKNVTEFIYDDRYVVRIFLKYDSLLLYYLLRRYADVFKYGG
ncbi:1-acyl-sn-glycerol-3-phosphate acyltransferase [Thermosipho ferrireducens]|uniref:1-acyl-sn-glycerol-3-phosphate acyltransferase n=1 Tax=Thermosipho ferrireducens TaxID=2571116 RepID=A0ABX7S6B8_9BACT|nr:1-acyl-sn-glycerol-3-phosphate acyltransferase [Thermosipho ferrireducens]QTA37371.1 1-acyl-sn-glycerol-3-phosphate acyltransferase [Thermosipho ferrireducens]